MAMKVCYTVLGGTVAAESRGGVRSRYVGDALSSPVALLNTSQAVSDKWSYWPYGEVTRLLGANPTGLLFVGGASCRQDSASRTYMQNRILAAATARWLTQDPIGFLAGDWNIFRYVRNNPTTAVDPGGEGLLTCNYVELAYCAGWCSRKNAIEIWCVPGIWRPGKSVLPICICIKALPIFACA